MPTQELISLELEKREILGKSVKNLRKQGIVPAVIHDHGKASNIVMGKYVDMLKVYRHAGKHHPVELTIGKEKYTALIKFAEFDPKHNQLNHIVFNAVNANQTVEAEVPLRLSQDIPAVKAGLMVIHQLDHILIEALPSKLIDEFIVDCNSLVEIGDKKTVADLIAPDGVTIITEPEHTIAIVEETKAQLSEESEEAEAETETDDAKEESKTEGSEK
jgi:large subunit ribosomal protein L25